MLQKVIQKCISLSKKYNISEYIKQANCSLIDLAKDPSTTAEEFQEAANKLKVETGYDVWIRFNQVRGSDDTVKFGNSKKRKGPNNDRGDSLSLKVISKGNNAFGQEDSLDYNDTNYSLS